MSIRAIDSQMMITRAAALSKDASSEIQKAQLNSEYQAAQTRVINEKERNSVQQADEADTVEILTDKDGANKDDPRGGGKKRRRDAKEGEKPASELQVASGEERKIDIIV